MKWNPLVEKTFPKKISQCRKNLKGDPLGFFNIHSVAKHQKVEGDPLGIFFEEKSHNDEKTERGTLWSLPVLYVTRKKRKTLLVQFARPNDSIWNHKIS